MSAPQGPPTPDAAILGYIHANRATYTRASIERTLREAGHPDEAIAAAWATVEREDAGTPAGQVGGSATLPGIRAPAEERGAPPPRSRGAMRLAMGTISFWVTLVGFLVGYIGLTTIVASGAVNLGNNASAFLGLIVIVIPLAALGVGIALSAIERTRPIGLGLLAALLLLLGLIGLLAVLAFIAVVIIFGVCLVAISRGNTP